jgi:hypothetical protein
MAEDGRPSKEAAEAYHCAEVILPNGIMDKGYRAGVDVA